MSPHHSPRQPGDRERRHFFDRHAERWDEQAHAGNEPERLHELLPETGIPSARRVLDVGCGTGRIIPVLLAHLPPGGVVIGLDYAEEMLRHGAVFRGPIARDPHAAMPFAGSPPAPGPGPGVPPVFAVAGDAAFPPLLPASLDAVFCYNVFPHFHDKAATLRALAALLRPGGSLTVCHLEGRESLNRFHAGVGDAVSHDMIPPDEVVRDMAGSAGLAIRTWRQAEDLYFLVCVISPD
ncbi:MAG: methyltransferase domain-containing protein [Acidobacteria bacterium]|nr:methyltransferase domain-containing protein [Acidobacteriota bacterium]